MLQGEQISDTDAAKLYEKTAKILVSSINESGAGQKSIYQHLLAAATLAILDLLSLNRPGKLTADDEKVLNNSAKLLKTAEINLGNIAKEWNGKSLSEDFAVESAMEINKIFGPSPRRRRGPR